MSQREHLLDELDALQGDVEQPLLSAESFSAPIERLFSKPALTVEVGASVGSAIAKLRESEYGAVCVVRERRLVGLLTERDLLCRVIGVLDGYEQRPVEEVMLPNPVRLRLEEPILYVLHNMHAEGYRHVPIVDENDEPISVVSIKDVVRYILNHFPEHVHNTTAEPFRGRSVRESG